MPANLADVAARAGVSMQTVSMILRGRGERFAEATRQRVTAAAEALSYRPNGMAQVLRRGRCEAVGLIMGTRRHVSHLPMPLLDALIDRLADDGRRLVVSRLDDGELADPEVVPALARSLHVDGFLVNYTHGAPAGMVEALQRLPVPAVWLNAPVAQDGVRFDDAGGARQGTEHLLRLGHRRIAYADWLHAPDRFLPGADHFSIAERYAGYRQAMAVAGLEPRILRHETLGQAELRQPDTGFLDRPDRPTAIISYSLFGLATVLGACAARGLAVPRDLSLLAFSDDGPPVVEGRRLDGVELPYAALGAAAVGRLASRPRSPALSLPCGLNTGISTGPA